MSEKPKAIVIGSGFGGLACAIRLQSAGVQVTLLEKRDKPGGRAYVYHDQGFTFDAGPTVITAPPCLEELFELSSRNLKDYIELLPVTPLYRLFWEDGFVFDYTNDAEKTLSQIKNLSPEDTQSYQDFLKYTEEVFEEGYTKLAHVPFLDWWSMIRVAPQLMRLEAYRSVYSIVSKYIKEPHLRQAFSFHSLLVGGNPFSTSSIYTLIHFLERKWGVYFPKGGTGALIQALVKLFEDLGGKLQCNTEIHEILTEDGKAKGVVTKKGEKILSDLVVSNADVFHTYHHLLKREPRLDGERKKLERSRFSMSLFVIYFGTKKQFPQFEHHNIVFGPRYKEHLADIFKRGHLADDFSLYVHRPTVSDPSMAPEGCDAFYALSPVPHLGKSDVDWAVEGPKYGKAIIDYLEKRYLPGLSESIVTQRIFTPLDFESELNARWGSAFSLEPVLHQSAFFRTHNRDDQFSNLYFVGAGTHPGAGIPGVVGSAKATAGLVLEDLKKKREAVIVSETPSLAKQCQTIIENGSKSFSLASRLFDEKTREAAFFLYGWCRYVDDAIDEVEDASKQKEILTELHKETENAFNGRPSQNIVFQALSQVAKTYRIPSYYATELLAGMQMDVENSRYEDLKSLSLYCYRVAGCVGLMMSHVMGVSEGGALRNASDLGIAMQLTNISRDVMTDARMGRVYLPLQWLKEVGMEEKDVLNPAFRTSIAFLVRRLLAEAEARYESGIRGLKYLPWRSAFAVAMAICVYRKIGLKVESRREKAWDSRTVVSSFEKVLCIFSALGFVVQTMRYRLLKPWKKVDNLELWRHQWNAAELS
ncbi:MAG: phytoene desaturase family protein [Pseudomonadota bacterium]